MYLPVPVSIHVPVPIPVSVAIPVPIPVPVPVSMPGYLGRWTEEVGYQACGILKRRVFMPVSNSLEVRELLGIDFLKVPNCSYRALRLPVWPIVEAPKGKWGSQRNFEQRRGTLPGVG
jgi:hypothetical protein